MENHHRPKSFQFSTYISHVFFFTYIKNPSSSRPVCLFFPPVCPKLTAILFVRTRWKVKETHSSSLTVTLLVPTLATVCAVACAVHTRGCMHHS